MSSYKKIRCPKCGASQTTFTVGRNHCNDEGTCRCSSDIYCSIKGERICGKTSVIFNEGEYEGTCEGCDQGINCHVTPKRCTGNNGCGCFDTSCADLCYEDGDKGCGGYFYFHPILRKAIYCPECGDFDVDTSKEKNIWDFKCNNCGHEFSLRKKNNNNP